MEAVPRDALIDRVNGLGILLVVYGHVARGLVNAGIPFDPDLFQFADRLIYGFHMPLFFAVSGLLFAGSFARHGTRSLLRLRLRTVAYPYLLWSLLQGGIEIGMAGVTNGQADWAQVSRFLIEPRAHFWFLYALFACNLLAVIAYRDGSAFRTVIALALAVACFVTQWSPIDVYAVNALSNWFVYFARGALGARFGLTEVCMRPAALLIAVTVFVLGTSGVASDWVLLGHSADRMLALAVACAGVSCCFAIAALPMGFGDGWLARLGRCSLEVYLAHVLAGSGVRIVLQKVFHIDDPALHLVLGMAGGIGLPLLLAALARRYGISRWLFGPIPWPVAR